MKKYSNLLLLLSASSGIIAAHAGCTFCKENAANGDAVSFDLSTLPSGTFTVMSPAPREISYYISSPCENAVAPVTQCCGLSVHSSGIQGIGSCYQLGLLQSNSTIDLVDGGNSGFNLTLYGSGEPGTKSCGGSNPPLWGHRASKYQFICDKDAPTNNVPTMVEEEVGCEYTIQWRHPAACPKQVGSTCPGQPLPPTPPEPSPTNSSNCQPHWKPTWDMKRSTILYACNASGFHDVQKAIQYGVVVYDWSNAKAIWANQHPMNDEELLTKQAEMVLAADPGIPGEQQRVWVYRNTIKALNWYTAVREKLDDPAYEGWFIKFKDYKGPSSNNSYHVPACTYEKCSGFYHDQEQTPEYPKGDGSCKEECDCGKAPCGEYIFDHRNASFANWYVNEYMISNETLLHKPIPIGLGWMDDSMKITGPTEENKYFINDTGSTPKDMQDMVTAYQRNKEYFHQRVIESGGWTWQLTHHGGSGVAGLNSTQKDQCAQTLRGSWCTPAGPDEWKATQRYQVQADDVTSRSTDITAEFLLTRGDYAWIGYGWMGCDGTDWPRASEWDQDYGGKAIGSCAETGDSTGVFQREYPKAVVEWDCNEAKGSIRMK